MNGILNVNKPAGWTSFDVVRFVRRGTGVKRVGHAGTLDPLATGVLPVCLGQATRVVEYLMDARKTYRATVRLGVVTDTYDAEGAIISETDASGVGREAIEAALAPFRGEIEQRPPAFSAIKRAGVPAYRLARAGEAVETTPRRVTVYRLDITDYTPPLLGLEVECSKGTYIRSLAHDLGTALGAGGSLAALERARVGSFAIEDAVDVETLRRAFEEGSWPEHLYALDEVLLERRAAVLAPESASRLRNGQTLTLAPARTIDAGERCRAYSTDGDFLAVLRYTGGEAWRPEKVFAAEG
jgi:tRNA pseudouridine55 synthase